MILALALLALGATLLYAGADLAVRGASGMVRVLGIPAFTLGALLFGIDIEGLGGALVASARGETQIAGGETFGTVVFLFAAAFGLALVLARRPVPAPSQTMILVPAIGILLAGLVIADRFVSRSEGMLLLLAYAGYVLMVLRERTIERIEALEEARLGDTPAQADLPGEPPVVDVTLRSRAVAETVAGLALVVGGAWLLVTGGVRLVEGTDLLAGFVGAAIVGSLASLDEVLLEVLPIRRGIPALATGNLFGTLAAFTTAVLGLAALIRPLVLDSGVNLAFLAAAALYALIATVMLARGKAGWVLGVVVLGLYGAWLAYGSVA